MPDPIQPVLPIPTVTATTETGFAEERRESLLKLAITSLQIGRQNLQDTQLSCDARVIGFYEAIALGLREPKQNNGTTTPDPGASSEDQLRLFILASSLAYEKIDQTEKEATTAHKIVGLEAICNAATLCQQRALQGQPLDKGRLELKKASQGDLSRAAELYSNVLDRTALCPEPDKSRLEMTAELGLLVCRFAAWCEELPGGVGEGPKAKVAAETAERLRERIDSARRQIASSPDGQDLGSASSQIIRQTEVFLTKVQKALPGQSSNLPAFAPPSSS